MNRRGMLAMVDAMLFIAVVMVAVSVTSMMVQESPADDRDASGLLDGMLSSKVRMSDLCEGGDDSIVRMSDTIALMVATGEEGVRGYLEELMDALASGRGYRLTLGFGGSETVLGTGSGIPSVSAERTVPVTTGGELSARLELFPS